MKYAFITDNLPGTHPTTRIVSVHGSSSALLKKLCWHLYECEPHKLHGHQLAAWEEQKKHFSRAGSLRIAGYPDVSWGIIP